LPAFVNDTAVRASSYEDIDHAFKMTGYFFLRHVWEPRAQTPPDSRGGFLNALKRGQAG
jgi:DNA repair protein RecO (recombination protein O)